jgi:UDP-N-acetylmuramate-alanine ligase
LVADAVEAAFPGRTVVYAPARAGLRGVVAGLLEPGDLCCTLGAGDLTTLPDELIADTSW